jgi:hypothetical protein
VNPLSVPLFWLFLWVAVLPIPLWLKRWLLQRLEEAMQHGG